MKSNGQNSNLKRCCIGLAFLATFLLPAAQSTSMSSSSSSSAQINTQRHTTIVDTLGEKTKLPHDLIKIIVDYDTIILSSTSSSVLDLILIAPSRLVATYQDSRIRIWNLETFRCEKTLEHETDISAITALPDDQIAVGVGKDENCSIKIWNINTGECLSTLTLTPYIPPLVDSIVGPIVGLVTLPNDQFASGVSAGRKRGDILEKTSGFIFIWNRKTGEVIKTIETRMPIYKLWPTQNQSFPLVVSTEIEQTDRTFVPGIVFIASKSEDDWIYLEQATAASNFVSFGANLFATIGENHQDIDIYTYPMNNNRKPKHYSPFSSNNSLFWKASPIALALPDASWSLANDLLISGGWNDNKIRIIDTKSATCAQNINVTARVTALATLAHQICAIGFDDGNIHIIHFDDGNIHIIHIDREKNNPSPTT